MLPPLWAADSLIDASTDSLTEGSITHFFYTWSQGKHILIGTALDTVLVCDFTITFLDTTSGGPMNYGTFVNPNIIAKADSAMGGLGNADLTGDGRIDYLFINFQSGRTIDSTGTYHSLNPGFSGQPGGVDYVSSDGISLSKSGGIQGELVRGTRSPGV